MAFTSTVTKISVVGDLVMVVGTFASSGGSTGGDISTGLRRVLHLTIQETGAAVKTNVSVVNETMPAETGDITIVCDANVAGTFVAYGQV